jgi:hypothetical protein
LHSGTFLKSPSPYLLLLAIAERQRINPVFAHNLATHSPAWSIAAAAETLLQFLSVKAMLKPTGLNALIPPPAHRIHRMTLSRIILARPTQLAVTTVSLGDGLLMSSRAGWTAAMIDAAITSIDANLSLSRRFPSQALARFISPIGEPRVLTV